MEEDINIIQMLIEAGGSPDMVEKYKNYENIDDKEGKKRMLCCLRRMCNNELQIQKKQLSCLDYMIAKMEETK